MSKLALRLLTKETLQRIKEGTDKFLS